MRTLPDASSSGNVRVCVYNKDINTYEHLIVQFTVFLCVYFNCLKSIKSAIFSISPCARCNNAPSQLVFSAVPACSDTTIKAFSVSAIMNE